MNINPCDDYILILPDEVPDETEGGIVVPKTAKVHRQSLTRRGTVLAVGPGRLLRNGIRAGVQCKPGDRVLYEEYEGYEHMFELEGDKRKRRFIREPALLGIIDETPPTPRTWQDERAERRAEEWTT